MDEEQLHQYFAGHALTGVLSSPRWSSTLLDMKGDTSETDGDGAKHLMDLLAKIAWNIADAMVVEGRERGHVDTPRSSFPIS